MDEINKGPSFDEEYRIRVLDAKQFSEADNLSKECQDFSEKATRFHETVKRFVETVDSQAQRIETEKLKAIGMRNRVEGEQETRRRKQRELKALISQKQDDLDRLVAQHDSLAKVDAYQKEVLEKLASE